MTFNVFSADFLKVAQGLQRPQILVLGTVQSIVFSHNTAPPTLKFPRDLRKAVLTSLARLPLNYNRSYKHLGNPGLNLVCNFLCEYATFPWKVSLETLEIALKLYLPPK